ncbi:ribosylpyrimidine nucleosidase [Lysinibacillus sphaericus]|uniref:nucleoside hydrolase n=1 Tax=Lysinibacillus sphaericus TaxID=1421 RepID=UPI0018CEA215|nr:nucleoside hydrolase [Lysinibacillus sphaericus]MBG9455932.1 ribosylpyrimidine nucleosidase [Lysinibacillus sphaericus]MBG9479577.1 ribosylpyrimidine nucleosidase [Lysinibacillus sphaericus]MBG9593942.1 ribosylpyrimidine nucleosidase [Lysinibacillus sphaericus]
MEKIPVIIDCDPGIDDVMALLLAFSRDDLDIKLITTEPGNQTQDKTIYNARAFTSYMKQNIEIARGLKDPLFRELEVADDVHGESGLGEVILPEPDLIESDRTAINALMAVLTESEDPIVLIATGPLTNIGALLLAHPEVKEKISYISYMGGAAVSGNMSPFAEFNVYVDPHAADIVFRSGIPIVMSGLDVTHKAYINMEELNQIESMGTDLSQKIGAMLRFYIQNAKNNDFQETDFESSFRLHDLCAVSYVVTPELFEGTDCFVAVETEGRLTAGATVVDYMHRSKKPRNVKVLHSVNREAFVNQFIEAVAKMGRQINQ